MFVGQISWRLGMHLKLGNILSKIFMYCLKICCWYGYIYYSDTKWAGQAGAGGKAGIGRGMSYTSIANQVYFSLQYAWTCNNIVLSNSQ